MESWIGIFISALFAFSVYYLLFGGIDYWKEKIKTLPQDSKLRFIIEVIKDA